LQCHQHQLRVFTGKQHLPEKFVLQSFAFNAGMVSRHDLHFKQETFFVKD